MPEPTTSPTGAESLRDQPLPPDAEVDAYLDQITRLGMANDELTRVQSGRVPLIVFSIDQLNAAVLVSYLQYARARIGPHEPSDPVAERLALDLERLIGVDCPELASVIARGRKSHGGAADGR